MLIYKRFKQNKNIANAAAKGLRLFGMALAQNAEPFIECATADKAKMALKQGRDIVGVTGVSFWIPFASLGVKVEATGQRLNVSGGLQIAINPTAEFRDFILTHDTKAELSSNELTLEFQTGLDLNLEPFLRHVINAEDIVQLRKFGKEAGDISALPDELPSWCEVRKVILAVDGTDVVSKYTEKVAKAIKKQEEAENTLTNIIKGNANDLKAAINVRAGVAINEIKQNGFLHCIRQAKTSLFIALLVALLGAWALRLVVFALGGGSPFARTCLIDFRNEKTASCDLQKYLLENFMQQRFQGRADFGSFSFGEIYHFKEVDAQTLRSWLMEYLNQNRGLVKFRKEDYNHPHGIPKILGWSKARYLATVEMEGRLEASPYHIVLKNDFDHKIQIQLDRLFLTCKSKSKGDVTEYDNLKLRSGDLEILRQILERNPELRDKGIAVYSDASPQEIIISVNNYSRSYLLDVRNLGTNGEYLHIVQDALKQTTGKGLFLKDGQVDLVLSTGDLEKLEAALKGNDRIAFSREEAGEKASMRLNFELSAAEKKRLDIQEKNRQQKVDWWKQEGPALLQEAIQKGEALFKEVEPLRIPENATDEAYEELKKKLQEIQQRIPPHTDALEKRLAEIITYYVDELAKEATDHEATLKKLSGKYAAIRAQLESLLTALSENRWQAKAARERTRRHAEIAKSVATAEQELADAQAKFRKEIPETVSANEADDWYAAQLQLAQDWLVKTPTAARQVQQIKSGLQPEFDLEGRTVKLEITDASKRLEEAAATWNALTKQLESLTDTLRENRWQAKASRERTRRHAEIAKSVATAEQELADAQAKFRKEIPETVSASLTKEDCQTLQSLADGWESRARTEFKQLERYRNQNLVESFTLENRKVTLEVAEYKTRVNTVLVVWSELCQKAINCRSAVAYRVCELTFKANQVEFWAKVAEFKSLGVELNAIQRKIQAKANEFAGQSLAAARQRKAEVNAWYQKEVVAPKSALRRRASQLESDFNALRAEGRNSYNSLLSRGFLKTVDQAKLGAYSQKLQDLVEEQEKRLRDEFGPKAATKILQSLVDKIEILQGQIQLVGSQLDDSEAMKRLSKILQ